MNTITPAQTSVTLKNIRRWLVFFMVMLILSGITASPAETELAILKNFTGGKIQWLNDVYNAIRETNAKYPYLSYGYDWLAFAHIVIALAFIGPYKDPVRNKWVIDWGMISCILVFPLAMIMGPARGIPFTWRLLDCSFGVFGILPLWRVYILTKRLEK